MGKKDDAIDGITRTALPGCWLSLTHAEIRLVFWAVLFCVSASGCSAAAAPSPHLLECCYKRQRVLESGHDCVRACISHQDYSLKKVTVRNK